MFAVNHLVLAALGALLSAHWAAAVPPNETVFASSALILTGQHTPLALALDPADESVVLTGRGAQQLNAAGAFFRNRYIATNSSAAPLTAIPGLANNVIDPSQLYLLAFDTQYNDASAQAFLQSLYPPYNAGTSNATSYPLSGYQYGWVHAASLNDPESVWVDGSAACLNLYGNNSFRSSKQYQAIETSTSELYSQVAAVAANSNVTTDMFSYSEAYTIYDFVSYQNEVNSTVTNGLLGIPDDPLDQLRYLADGYLWNTYGSNYPSSVNRIAGQTAAYALLSRLATNMEYSGEVSKLSAFFANLPAFISIFSLLDLPATQPDFYGMPQPGSTLVFELFAENVGSNPSQYPDTSEMRVRVLFRNGTDVNTTITTYMTNDSGDISMSWVDFVGAVSNFAVGDFASWCTMCDSWDTVPFCLAFNSTAVNAVDGVRPAAMTSSGLDPKLAGVIGAVATLGALGLFLVLGVGCCGLRLVTVRHPQRVAGTAGAVTENKSGGGFKGMQKLASDPDLKASAAKKPASGIEVVKDREGGTVGHSRVGSWELKETGGKRRSFDEESRIEGEGLGRVVEPAERV